jgi:hypothetical protein
MTVQKRSKYDKREEVGHNVAPQTQVNITNARVHDISAIIRQSNKVKLYYISKLYTVCSPQFQANNLLAFTCTSVQ